MRFDANACIAALQQHLLLTLKLLQKEYLAEARSGMRTREGAESLHEGDIETLAGWMAATVVGGAWAVMDEFGTGSLMDRDNQALPDYMKSDLWNPYRGKRGADDTTIRSRQAGAYINIFGETAVSRAPRPGFNLEQLGGKYAPQPPSRAMRTAARWMMAGRAEEIWRKSLATFPWGKLIIATPD